MKVVGYIFVTIVAMLVCAFISGFTLSTIWGWFMVPIFGLPSLSIAGAYAVSLVVTTITHQYKVEDYEKNTKPYGEQLIIAIIFAFAKCFIVLTIGWTIKLFM